MTNFQNDRLTADDIKILVAYHKPAFLIKNKILTPIHTGRSIDNTGCSSDKHAQIDAVAYKWLQNNMIGADTGDNIASKNLFYSELTRLYWAWKNPDALSNPKFIGLIHYKRQLIFDDEKVNLFAKKTAVGRVMYVIDALSQNDLYTLFSEEQIINSLQNADVLISKAIGNDYRTIREEYQLSHIYSDLQVALAVIDKKFPKYKEAANRYLDSRGHVFCNMFVMPWELFDEYCHFLFGVLFELEKKIDISDHNVKQQRAFGYLGERLLGVFITSLQLRGDIRIKNKYSIFEKNTDIPMTIKSHFEERNIPIVFISNNTYAPYLAVAIGSLLTNCSSDKNYDIFVVSENISDKNRNELLSLVKVDKANVWISFIDVAPYLTSIDKSIFYIPSKNFNIISYYKFFLPRIFNNFEKIIYLDSDIVVLDDISALYNLDLTNNLLAVAKDMDFALQLRLPKSEQKLTYAHQNLKMKNADSYFSSAVLVMNLKEMREFDFENQALSKLKEIKTPGLLDQDILNSLYDGQVTFLPLKWNVQWHLPFYQGKKDWHGIEEAMEKLPAGLYNDYIEAYHQPSIIHYSSKWRPWQSPELPLANFFWHFARLTPFYEEIIARLIDFRANSKINRFKGEFDAQVKDAFTNLSSRQGNNTSSSIAFVDFRHRLSILIKNIVKSMIYVPYRIISKSTRMMSIAKRIAHIILPPSIYTRVANYLKSQKH